MELTVKLQPKVPMFSVKNLVLNQSTVPPVTEGKLELSEQEMAEINIINSALLEGTIEFGSAKEEKEFATLLKKAIDYNEKQNKTIHVPEKGKTIIVNLPKGRVIWQSNDEQIQINSFMGESSKTLNLSELTPSQKDDIRIAIQTGQLVASEVEIKKLNGNTSDIDLVFEEADDTFLKFIRFTLDSPIDQFKSLFDKSFKHEHVILIKKIEQNERNRKEYIEVLDKALLAIK